MRKSQRFYYVLLWISMLVGVVAVIFLVLNTDRGSSSDSVEWEVSVEEEPAVRYPLMDEQEEDVSVKREAPSFKGVEFTSGKLKTFPCDWEGDVVYINFFSGACPVCFEKMLELDKDGIKIVNITTDHEEHVKQFFEEQELVGELFIDYEYSVGDKYGVRGIPYGVFVDEEGNIKEEKSGWDADSKEEWKQKATELLE